MTKSDVLTVSALHELRAKADEARIARVVPALKAAIEIAMEASLFDPEIDSRAPSCIDVEKMADILIRAGWRK